MKPEGHPKYHANAKVICACGNTFSIGSTAEEMRVEMCSQCHPFYTGKQKVVDTQRRVERFQKILEKKDSLFGARTTKKKTATKGK